jgi:glycosyltransferase involved in cell wall biosynthesis
MTKKILFIANGNSIHDIKWITYFSEQDEKYTCYLLCDTLCIISEQTAKELAEKKIQLVQSIEPFSIANIARTWQAIRYFKQLTRDINPDLIHVLFTTPHALWLNFVKKPYILTMRGSDILIVIPDLLKEKGIKRLYFNYLYKSFRRAFRNAKAVTGTSFPQIEKAKSLFNIDSNLIRTGVNVTEILQLERPDLIPNTLQGKKYVFSPRFMSPIYNIEFQINAIEKLSSEMIQNYVFVFIRGKQYDTTYFSAQSNKLEQLKRKINLQYVILDFVDQLTMWTLLKNTSLCLITPVSDGTPNSALEAMSAKCPLILSNLNYDQDLFGDSAIQLKSFEVEELTGQIQLALTNYPSKYIQTGFSKVNELGNRLIEMQKLEQLYQKVFDK